VRWATRRERDHNVDSDASELESEIGDLLFSVVNLARFLQVDTESALRHTNRRFTRRFRRIEALLEGQGKEMKGQTLAELDRLWEQAKREEARE